MYIGNDLQIAHPSYKIIDDISSGFNGSTTSFALQVSGATPVPFPISTQQVMISVNGVVQEPDPTGNAGFKLLGSNIVFSSAPANGHAFFGVINAGADYVTAGSEFPDGSATSPSFTFQDDQDTGWFRSGSGAVGYSSNGAQTLTFDGNGLTVTGDASFVGDSSKNLLWDKSDGALEFADNAKAVFGTGSDLQIWHDGSNSKISDVGTGDLQLLGANVGIYSNAGESMVVGIANGAVELFYDNAKKLETTAGGIAMSGVENAGAQIKVGIGNDIQIEHDGSNSYFSNTTGHLSVQSDDLRLTSKTGGESYLKGVVNGAVELYHDNVKVFETEDNGAYLYGPEGGIAQLMLYADEGDDNADKWRMATSTSASEFTLFNFNDGAWETSFKAVGSAGVHFYYDNSTVCYTDTDALRFNDSKYLKFGSSQDLKIFHDGSHNKIECSNGQLHIKSSQVDFINAAGSEYMLRASQDGSVDLYYNNSKKLETTSAGITVTGTVTATAFSGSGANLTNLPPSGGSFTAAASGALTAKDAVIVNSSGQAAKIVKTTSQQTPATSGTPGSVYAGTATTGQCIVYASSIDRFFCGYRRNNYIYGRMGQVVSGNAISWGTEIAVSPSNGSNPQVTFDASAGIPVYVWQGSSNTTSYCRPMGINTSNNTMSHGTVQQIGTNAAGNPNIVYDESAQRCVMVWKQTNDNKVVTKYIDVTNASTATVYPNNSGYGTYLSSNNGSSQSLGICYDPDASKVVAFWRETGGTHSGKTGVCSITTPSSGGSASTIGSTYYWIPANNYVPNGFTCDYDKKENRVVTAYTNAATSYQNIQIAVGTWNGSTYGMGTNHGNSVNSTNGLLYSTYDSTAERVVVAWGEQSPQSKIRSFSVGGSGMTVTESSIGDLDDAARSVGYLNGRTGFADYPTGGGMMMIFRDDGQSDYVNTLFVTSAVPSTNLNTGNFGGFVASSVSSGQTATINTIGGTTSWTASTLTPGTKYYVQADGTLGTSVDTLSGSVSAGLALTSSTLLIK